jgi:ribosome-binding factor A
MKALRWCGILWAATVLVLELTFATSVTGWDKSARLLPSRQLMILRSRSIKYDRDRSESSSSRNIYKRSPRGDVDTTTIGPKSRQFDLSVDVNYQTDLRKSIRKEKMRRIVQEALSSIIWSGIKSSGNKPPESLFRSTTVTDIIMSSDCSSAEVFISTSGRAVDGRQMYVWLVQHVHLVRHALSQRLGYLRKVPRIKFSRGVLTDGPLELLSVLDRL